MRARRALLRAVELAPEVATYRITLGDLLRRQRYTRAGNRMLLDAVRLDPGAGDGWCDACPIAGGESTENEMFILLGQYFIAEGYPQPPDDFLPGGIASELPMRR